METVMRSYPNDWVAGSIMHRKGIGGGASGVTRQLTEETQGTYLYTIGPYADLLLHDMGDGLADGRPEGEASGREWRVQPARGDPLARRRGGASETARRRHDTRAARGAARHPAFPLTDGHPPT